MNADYILEEFGKQFNVTHERFLQMLCASCVILPAQTTYVVSSTTDKAAAGLESERPLT